MATDDDLPITSDATLLRDLQRIEATGQIARGLAHEFNNLLQGIGGSMQVMRRRIAQGRLEEADKLAAAASMGVDRAAALTQRLHALAGGRARSRNLVDVGKLVTDTAELCRVVLGRATRVDCDVADGLWMVLCDPAELDAALIGLCLNARDAMPRGGRLAISAANVAGSDGGDQVAMTVRDFGAGLEPDGVSAASRLRLSAALALAKEAGGTVQFTTVPGSGASVTLSLPRANMRPASAPHANDAQGNAAGASAAGASAAGANGARGR